MSRLLNERTALILLTAFVSCCYSIPRFSTTPLDDYVNKEDPTYKYVDTGYKVELEGYTAYFINMTSQTWLTANDVDRSVWWHYLVINVPSEVKILDTGFVYNTGGSNTDSRPDLGSSDLLLTGLLATTTGAVTASLFQIPNEPILFKGDPIQKHRGEDSIIAYTWYHFIQNKGQGVNEWPLRLPMTKAVVRAMDTVTDYVKKLNSSVDIQKFVVAGASKRGWTTWTTGAVDKRVIAIVPIVMDLLNMVENLHHHYRSLGGWTFAFSDYLDLNITASIDSPYTQQIADIVDPYSYIDRLTMPKLVVCTSGDEFFLNDDSYYFWNKLKGEAFLRTFPNCEHSLAGHTINLEFDIRAFFLSVVQDYPRPKLSWNMTRTDKAGSITLFSDTKAATVYVYHASTLDDKRRDFRLLIMGDQGKPIVHPVIWERTNITSMKENPGDYEYHAELNNPEFGWRGFFIQATFQGPGVSMFEFTTQVNIIPGNFPFPDCHGEGCRGKLV